MCWRRTCFLTHVALKLTCLMWLRLGRKRNLHLTLLSRRRRIWHNSTQKTRVSHPPTPPVEGGGEWKTWDGWQNSWKCPNDHRYRALLCLCPLLITTKRFYSISVSKFTVRHSPRSFPIKSVHAQRWYTIHYTNDSEWATKLCRERIESYKCVVRIHMCWMRTCFLTHVALKLTCLMWLRLGRKRSLQLTLLSRLTSHLA